MSVLSGLSRFFSGSMNGTSVNYAAQVTARTRPVELPARELYAVLRAYSLNNGLYSTLRQMGFAVGGDGTQIKSIRNPTSTVVQWFGSKTFPEPLEVITENEAIIEPIKTIWQSSNGIQSRRLFARYLALFGECYLKCVVADDRSRVHQEVVSPEYVTEYSADERGFLTMIRIDIPRAELQDDNTRQAYTHVELWDRAESRYRTWRVMGDAVGRAIRDLGTPVEDVPLSVFGIDWLPFVRVVFSEWGTDRGIGAVQLALEAISEGDLSATHLHESVFADLSGAWVATASGVDAAQKPLPPLRMAAAEPTYDALGRQTSNGTGLQSDGTVSVGQRSFYRLPAGYDLKSIVAQVNLAGALAILQDHDGHLEQLMPSLAYAKLSGADASQLSGRAIRYRLSAAIDQVMEVRANALAGLEQANMQALTLGQQAGLFKDLGGTYEDGKFAHSFAPVDILPLSAEEQAAEEVQRAAAYSAWISAGLPMAEALRRLDYQPDQIEEILTMAAEMADSGEGEPTDG